MFSLDRVLAREWYFNVAYSAWLGAGAGEWWARGLLHTGGRWAGPRRRSGALCAVWALSFRRRRLADLAAAAGFVLLAMLLATLHRRWPESRHQRGLPLGSRGLRRPQPLRRAVRRSARRAATCAVFSGRTLFVGIRAAVFLLRVPRPFAAAWRAGRWRGAIAVGVAFSIGQEARGAHFLSHDLTSAAIVWFVQLALYAAFQRRRAQTLALASSGR